MEDDNSMSERILKTLEAYISNDPNIQDFTIVPIEQNVKNKCPVLYQDHNLGLESWCVKYIYRYAYLELFDNRKQLARGKLSFCKEQNLNHLLVGVLLINPDVSTFWNMKRELVNRDVLNTVAELQFTKLVLSYKSKSNEAFTYRRWLLKKLLTKIGEDGRVVQNLLNGEFSVCELAAGKSQNNYHAWTHRIWCLENFKNRIPNLTNFVCSELQNNQEWISKHVSEHTGYHYRQFLLSVVRNSICSVYETQYNQVVDMLKLVTENDPSDILTYLLGPDKNSKPLEEKVNFVNFVCLLLLELNFTESLNSLYQNHESIFYHRRFTVFNLIKTAYEYHGLEFKIEGKLEEGALYGTNIVNVDNFFGEKQAKLFKTQPNKVEASFLYQNLVKSESEFIKNNTNSADFCGLELTRRYEKWLKFVVNFKDL